MPPESPGPTAREFDMLRGQVEMNQRRLADIDDHGSKGVTGLTVQMTELVKDIGELKAEFTGLKVDVDRKFESLRLDVENRFEGHARRHTEEVRERVRGRRWVIGTMIAAILSLCAVITLLVLILQTVHH